MSIAPLRHTPIRRKLLTLALAAGLAFVTVSALFVLSWRDLEKASARVGSTYLPTLRDGAAALVSVSSLGTELFRYVNQIEPSAYRVADALEGARAALQRISGSDIPPEIGANIEALLPMISAHESGLRRLTAGVERDDALRVGEEHARMAAEAGVMLRGVERINGQLLDSILEENRSGVRDAKRRATVVALLSLFCILAALLYAVKVRRDLEEGLEGLREGARRYAARESVSIEPLDRGDEIGQLSNYLNRLSTQLSDQRQRLELVISASRAGIVDWDGATRKGWFSARFKELLGYPADADSSSWTFFDRVHPEDRDSVRAQLIEHLKGGNPETRDSLTREYRMLRADGSPVWVQAMGLSVRGADGRSARFLAAITDISARRAQEDALQDQVKLTRDLIDGNPNPVYLKDEQCRFVDINPAYTQLTRVTPERAKGKTVFDLYQTERAALFDRQDRELLARGEGSSVIEVDYQFPERKRHFLMSKTILKRADGSVRGLIGTLTDITELNDIAAQLRASREDALQAAQAKSAFLAAMSHEIRTPLNGVLGMAGLLEGTHLTPEQREYVETIQVSGDALLAVINDILDYSKIESGRMELEHAALEPVRAIEESLEILGARARAKGLELIAEIDDGVPAWVLGDLARLRQVLVNLVGNAVKFTDAGEVVVSVRAPAAGVLELAVRDTGIGIPAERIGALFEAFAQGDASTTRKYGGTGLGLAISRRLVELMGGELRVQSEPGRGSTFSFTMRAAASAAGEARPALDAAAALQGKRLLVVDDNETNRRILARQLERWGASQVAESSAAAALERLTSDAAFDAALLDYHMPGMDGVMLARELRRRGLGLPLVLLSSSMYRRAEEAEATLFSAQLLKPIRQQQLQEALAAALAGRRYEPGPARRSVHEAPRLAEQLPMRILVVDDVEVNRRLAVSLLRNFGYAADAVGTGREAVELAATYDLLLMDVQMPDVDGLEATRLIRSRAGKGGPRIVALTASAMAGDRERCLAAGMDDYLAKPLQPQALQAALEQVGRSAARQAGMKRAARPAGAVDWGRIESLKPFDPDGSMVAGAIAAFLADAPGRIRAIRDAHAAGDAQALISAAHALKGAAANIGAARLQELSQAIESLAREDRVAEARKAIGGLEKSLAEAAGALAKGGASP
jgi:PAS domain S-box-containing protein